MADLVLRDGALSGAKIAVLIESDYFEPEIHYYQRRFAEEGAEVHFLTRLWGQREITLTGHEWRVQVLAHESLGRNEQAHERFYAGVSVAPRVESRVLSDHSDVDTHAPE